MMVSLSSSRISMLNSLFLISFFNILPYVTPLDEKSAFEKECFVPNVENVEVDYDWVLSNTDWYFPLMSKLELYRMGWDTLQKPVSDISEEEVALACTRVTWEGLTPRISGFGGKELIYDFTPNFDNTFTYAASWREGTGGQMYLTKTDNKNYIVFVKCWEDGQVSWHAMSLEMTLKPAIKTEILEHVKSLGLSEDFLIEQNYSNCDFSRKEEL